MKKFLFIVMTIVFWLSVVATTVFGILWNNTRHELENNSQSEIVIELNTRISDLQTELKETIAKSNDKSVQLEEKTRQVAQLNNANKALTAEKDRLESENTARVQEIVDLIAENDRQINQLNSEIAELNSQIEELNAEILTHKATIATLQSELNAVKQELAQSEMQAVDFQLTEEQANTTFSKETSTGSINSIEVVNFLKPSMSAGAFKQIKEAYILADDLILISEFEMQVDNLENPLNSKLVRFSAYSRIKYKLNTLSAETLTAESFIQMIENCFNNDERIYLNSMSFYNGNVYLENSAVAEYITANQNSTFNIYGNEVSINDFYFNVTSTISTGYPEDNVVGGFKANLMIYKNEKPIVYLDIPFLSLNDAPKRENGTYDIEAITVMLLESLRVKDSE